MIIKSIIGLILAIAVGALGVSSLGEGIFGFLDKSKAGKMVEDARELSRIHAIYKTDNRDGLTAFAALNALATPVPLVGADVTYYGLVEDELNTKDLVKRGFSASQGEFTYVEMTTGDEGIYLVNASAQISKEVCDKINDIVGLPDDAAVPYAATGNAATDVLLFANNQTEFFCAEDSTATGVNAFVYYLAR